MMMNLTTCLLRWCRASPAYTTPLWPSSTTRPRASGLGYFVRSRRTNGTKLEPDCLLDSLQFLSPYVESGGPPKLSKRDSIAEEAEGEDGFDEFRYRLTFMVKRHPCLYNRTVACTSSKFIAARSRAWSAISTRLGGEHTPEDCRLTWEAIRARYTAYLEGGGVQSRKPFVLANSLIFLKPFIKRRLRAHVTCAPLNYKFNCRLVRVIRGFPCLYDTSLPAYGRKQNEATWLQVARAIGGNVTTAFCRKRWSCIRSVFASWVRKKDSYYYLAEHLEFLRPFIKPYDLGQVPVDASSDIEQEVAAEDTNLSAESGSAELKDSFIGQFTQAEHFQETSSIDSSCSQQQIIEEPQIAEFLMVHGTDCTLVDTADDDALFLLGLAPNLRQLDAKQKRAFKARMLLLAQEMSSSEL